MDPGSENESEDATDSGVPSAPYAKEGQRLKLARMAAGLTQKELADKVNASLSTIKGYERGVRFPKRRSQEELARAGINWDFVVRGENRDVYLVELKTRSREESGATRELDRIKLPEGFNQLQKWAQTSSDLHGAPADSEYLVELRRNSELIEALCRELDFRPSIKNLVLVQELMMSGGLNTHGARRLLATLKVMDHEN